MAQTTKFIQQERRGNTTLVTFDSKHRHNPMSAAMNEEIAAACRDADADPAVRALVLTGGIERSFCVGGDFREVQTMTGGTEVEEWIDRTIGLYISVLSVNKPVIAAIDGYAIGIGFQVALCCDWRLGTEGCEFVMPELAKGIACVLGSYMLERSFGRARMMQIMMECRRIPPGDAIAYQLLQEVAPVEELIERAMQRAEELGRYPATPFKDTKRFTNRSFIEGLHRIAAECKAIHQRAFAEKCAAEHFKAVLSPRPSKSEDANEPVPLSSST